MTDKIATPSDVVPLYGIAFGAEGSDSVAVDASNPLPVTVIGGSSGTLVSRSGTITAGGAAQVIAAANAARKGYMIQNVSSGDLWFSTLGPAVLNQPSIKLAAGQSYETPASGFGTGAISIIGATTGQAFAAREW